MKNDTQVGSCFRRARSKLTLRQVEEATGINRETWRSYEVGRFEPPKAAMKRASELDGAPAYEEFVAAALADKKERLLAPA